MVRPSDSESTTASGLVIPDTAQEKPQQGDVLAVGPGRRSEQTGELVPMDVAEGDRSEEHTSELQSLVNLVCRLLLEKKKKTK